MKTGNIVILIVLLLIVFLSSTISTQAQTSVTVESFFGEGQRSISRTISPTGYSGSAYQQSLGRNRSQLRLLIINLIMI
ncbi:MAG: hypothetical protein KKD28_12665 [Chloroflexi bacterium]|nr:hypothetical protein [Chloroflexota bacterium]MBU1662311.1 hypothetical protein [Chloroflexota bacterium]